MRQRRQKCGFKGGSVRDRQQDMVIWVIHYSNVSSNVQIYLRTSHQLPISSPHSRLWREAPIKAPTPTLSCLTGRSLSCPLSPPAPPCPQPAPTLSGRKRP